MAPRQRRIIWTDQARTSLDEAVAYLAARSLPASRKFLNDVLDAAGSLAALSERGRVVPETSHGAIREIFVQRYRLLYEVRDAEVRILALLHGSRDFTTWHRLGRPRGTDDTDDRPESK